MEAIPNSQNVISIEENDLLDRSTKKPKRRDPQSSHTPLQQLQPQPTFHPIPSSNTKQFFVADARTAPVQRKQVSFCDLMVSQMHDGPSSSIQTEDDDDFSDDDLAPEDMEDDPKCPVILLTKEEKKKLRAPWKHALIIKLYNHKIGYMSLMKRLQKKWELKGTLTLTDIGHDFFIARFSTVTDYNHVLTHGPWMLDDCYLTIRKWIPNFVPDDNPIRFLTAWV